MLRRLVFHLRQRVPLLLFVGAAALYAHRQSPPAAEPTLEGLAATLGEAIGGEVAPGELVWESSRGVLLDALWGRRVLFLGSAAAAEQRDVYRARVRVSREGYPIVVRSVNNLTQTALADEQQLLAHHGHAAFVSKTADGVTGVTVLGLSGHRFAELTWRARLLLQLDNWLQLGSADGVARREVVFNAAPAEVQLELRDTTLVMALGSSSEAAALELDSARLITAAKNTFAAEAWLAPRYVKLPQHALVDSFYGLLGEGVARRAHTRLLRRHLEHSDLGTAEVPAKGAPEPQPNAAESVAAAWPPAALEVVVKPALEHEGEWRAAGPAWLAKSAGTLGEAPPYLLRSFVRPNEARPDASVMLVAMDTRQLELRMEAGFERPRPATGPRGRGRIPEAELPMAVAAFNGALLSREANAGMLVKQRLLSAPLNDLATVAVDQRGVSYVGRWRGAGAVPTGVVSLRQSATPLIENGAYVGAPAEPLGDAVEAAALLSERSALCRTRGGYLIYGWGAELTAVTLAKALIAAGCVDALHLDLTAGHAGFSFVNGEVQPAQNELLAAGMTIAPQRFVEGSARDFFYLVLREHAPKVGEGLLEWKPDDGVQPEPAWLPAVYRAKLQRLGVEVSLLAVDSERFHWDIRPGAKERYGQTSAEPLSDAQRRQALIALNLGVAARGENKRGLALNGVVNLPLRAGRAVLATRPQNPRLLLGRAPANFAPAGDASELLLWAEGGGLRPEAQQLDRRRLRTAVCQIDSEQLLVASAVFDSGEAVTRALLDIGCQRVAELNRGSQLRALVIRASGDTRPEASYRESVLFGFAEPKRGVAQPLRALSK